jgi:hypothetical protein
MDRQDMETVEEVLSKGSLLHRCLEVSIRGGDDPNADRNLVVFTDAEDAVLLQHAQQLGLEGIGQFADLIEEEDAAFGGTNQTSTIVIRPGKRAAPVPKQFALGQAGTDRTTVECHERPRAPLAIQLVNGMGQELLSRSRLTRDQDREVTERANPANHLEDRHDGLALSYTPQFSHQAFESFLFLPFPGFGLEELR